MKNVWNKTDVAVQQVYCCLAKDFSRFDGHPFIMKSCTELRKGPKAFRALEWPVSGVVDPYRFKIRRQLQELLKRHRFHNDVYSDDELAERSESAFLADQIRLSVPLSTKAFIRPVLGEARRIARTILGSNVDMIKLRQGCRIGKRATLGSVLQEAYLDRKLTAPQALTCPSSLKTWFFEYLTQDPRLKAIVARILRQRRVNQKVPAFDDDVLNLVNVPKSWKALRGISPLQLIALFYSYGYKDLVEDALEKHNLPIRKLQDRHKKLAKRFSKRKPDTQKVSGHATVDLKSASQSIVSWLLNAVLPRQWYTSLRPTFMRKIRFASTASDSFIYCETVLPMGNAATFPIETLVFYCLIKAVGNLLKVKGTYSVYGDDLIYPCKIHSYVAQVFSALGLHFNADKTFASLSCFRESCGGDYYQGVDVRPALAPEYNGEELSSIEYTAWLYKLTNSLRRRWHDCEIPSTILFLESELAYHSGGVNQVPPTYPDYSGIRTRVPTEDWVVSRRMPFRRLILPNHLTCESQDFHRWEIGFHCLTQTVDDRIVETERVYYWELLKNWDLADTPFPSQYLCGLYWLTQPTHERTPWKVMKGRLDYIERDRSPIRLRRISERLDGVTEFIYLPVENSKASPRLNNQICSVIHWT